MTNDEQKKLYDSLGTGKSHDRDTLIREAFGRHGNKRRVMRETGHSWELVNRIVNEGPPTELRELAEAVGSIEPATPEPNITESGDRATVEIASFARIRTLEDAVAYAEVDTHVWRVSKWSCTAWETGMKLRVFNDKGRVTGETPHATQQWRVKLDLERILPKPLQDATDAIFASMKEYSPRYPKLAARVTPAKPHMCVVDLFDVHFGKLAWDKETGENYDLKIAEQLYRNAVEDLLSHAAAFEIDQFVLPIGNDFFHIDGLKNETTNGTPQDVDGRFAKIFETGCRAVIWAIEEMRHWAAVSVPLVPGNHDRLTSYALAQYIKAWFRHCDNVTVDSDPIPRKRIRYGNTLIALTHGNEEKHSSLPAILATEWKQDWAETETHEVMLGHFHRAKKTETTSVDTHNGVTVRTLMSLSGTDAWHYRRGFCGNTRAAEAFIYGFEDGFIGNFVAKARLEGGD